MTIKLYLDTSIPSAYYDTSNPRRQNITQKWFENDSNNFELYTSNITFNEIYKIKNETKKLNIESLLLHDFVITCLQITAESQYLAEQYMINGAIPKSEPEDAHHIAIAVINQIDAIASWNFKHIVSINPIKKIHEINLKMNYSLIEIGTLEIFGGNKYGYL